MWFEIVEIAKTIIFFDDEDQLIWKYESRSVYSSKSLYDVINFGGVQPVFLPAVWNLKIPLEFKSFSGYCHKIIL
jgi:hypothetical protein